MSTLVVVKKNGIACIAADTLTSFGDNKQSAAYVTHSDKIYQVGESYLGIVGSAAHDLVMRSIFLDTKPNLRNRLEIFEFFRQLHPRLKEEYFLVPSQEDEDPYESNHLELCIANPHGIFGLYSLREVDEYQKFWAMGSGSEYALGAMYAMYDSLHSAEEIARLGIQAGIEFDNASAGPMTSYCIYLID